MIESITLFHDGTPIRISIPDGTPVMCHLPLESSVATDIWAEIVLSQPALAFRNHDHTWVDVLSTRYAGELSPKILKLADGLFLSANITGGTWVVEEQGRKLIWHFRDVASRPLTSFVGPKHEKEIVPASFSHIKDAAVIVAGSAVEFSRSEIPFSAIACFTDHCDYDTAETLPLQRELFREAGVTVTKGFFPDHYSKRADNASFEHDSEELLRWRQDGHELAYHSLSQSILEMSDALSRFEDFAPPIPSVTTYIDHGYQPYNASLYRNSGWSDSHYAELLAGKTIDLLWNYIDCGTAGHGIINQMNPGDFNVRTFFRSTSGMAMKKRLQMLIRNGAFHHFGDKKTISAYMSVASQAKQAVRQRNSALLFGAAGSGVHLMKRATSLFGNSRRPYQLAKYAPVVFSTVMGNRKLRVFQTIEMTDFKSGLCSDNLHKLVRERGLFIAHTYFAAPFDYHHGRMISDGGVNAEVRQNFLNLGELIRNGEIWNPTVSALANHLIRFEDIRIDIDTDGLRVTADVPFRNVQD